MAKPGQLLRSVGTVGSLTLVSRLMGYGRDILTAAMVGAGPLGDAFTFALTLPNSFRQIFAEGAFNAAFVPTYTETQTKEGKESAARFAGQVMALLLMILLPLCLFLIWQMPSVVALLSSGYDPEGERFAWAVTFGRIMFAYLLFVSLVALGIGILNANRKFAPGPYVQIGYNVVLILALLGVVPLVGYPAHVLASGVLIAGILQFVVTWFLVAMLVGSVIIPRLPRFDPKLRRMLLLMGPGIGSAAGLQIASLLNRALASDTIGAQSQLYFAERLYFLPLAIIGIAFGIVILPTLTKALSEDRPEEAQSTLSQGLQFASFIAIPSAVGLALLSEEILSSLFQYGAFDAETTQAAGAVLLAFSLGLPAVIAQRILYPAFFARKDTLTPMLITLLGVVIQVSCAVLLYGRFGVFGLGLSVSIAAWIQTVLVLGILMRRGFWRFDAAVVRATIRVALAAGAMGLALFAARFVTPDIFGTGSAVLKIPLLSLLILGGGFVFALCAVLFGAVPPSAIAALRRIGRRGA